MKLLKLGGEDGREWGGELEEEVKRGEAQEDGENAAEEWEEMEFFSHDKANLKRPTFANLSEQQNSFSTKSKVGFFPLLSSFSASSSSSGALSVTSVEEFSGTSRPPLTFSFPSPPSHYECEEPTLINRLEIKQPSWKKTNPWNYYQVHFTSLITWKWNLLLGRRWTLPAASESSKRPKNTFGCSLSRRMCKVSKIKISSSSCTGGPTGLQLHNGDITQRWKCSFNTKTRHHFQN